MVHFPSTPIAFLDMLGISIRHHFAVLKKTILLIVMIVIVKDLYIYLGGMRFNTELLYKVSHVMLVLLMYLFSVMIYIANRVLRN